MTRGGFISILTSLINNYMTLKLTTKQRQHILSCLQYCQGKIINYGNIGMPKFSYKMNDNLIDKLNKENKGNNFIH